MSSLRKLFKFKKGTDLPKGDIEAPLAIGNDSFVKGLPSAPRGAHYNPIFLTKAIFRKVLDLLLSTNREDLGEPGWMITWLKDILLGVVFGVMVLSFLVFLDHSTAIDFQSAHYFRHAALQLLNDPDTAADIEVSLDLKFMAASEYASKRKIIDGAAATIRSYHEILQTRTKEIGEMQKDMDSRKAEHEHLRGNPLLSLKDYCGACPWKGMLTCDERVLYLQDTYDAGLINARINAMEHTSCLLKESQEGTEHLVDYCGACLWSKRTPCDQRVHYLQISYGISLATAKTNAMVHASCISKEKKEEGMENLDAYCGACIWRGNKTCDGRVQYLRDTYKTSLTAAKIDAMMNNACTSVK